jgi:hypothetical protein
MKKTIGKEDENMSNKIDILIKLVIAGIIITMVSPSVLSEPGDPVEGEPGHGNCCPHADAGGPYYGTTQQAIAFDGSGSYDSDGTVVGWCWDWTGDGTWDTGWETTPTISHQYITPGAYTLKLKVKDNLGAQSFADSTTVFVNGVNSLDFAVQNTFPWIWPINTWIRFYIAVENANGPGIYWFDVELTIWDDLQAPDPLDTLTPIHFETTNSPLMKYDVEEYNRYWLTLSPNLYWIKGVVTCGSDTEEASDTFTVVKRID